MRSQRISAFYLLQATFAVVGAVYPALLTINSPHLIWLVLNTFGRDGMLNTLGITTSELDSATVPLNIIYLLVAVPFLWGATTFYTYRILTKNQVTVRDACTQATRRLLPLILVNFLSVVLLLAWAGLIVWLQQSLGFLGLMIIIPGLYVLYRLIFSSYATVIDNCSVLGSFNSSWQLTKGCWGLVFRSSLLIIFVFYMTAILIPEFIGSRLGNALASQLMTNLLGFIAGMLMNVYFVLLYKGLR
ncbi:hypothetical protein QUB63_24000 [Microcoleus sp. ARI1-B5]|uniref:hypothetical protein n=1 Tax=unclassified Microcoleus TaxID=2642155 RepID=UPI002FD6BE97